MSNADHLGAYAEGWANGDVEKIVATLSGWYFLDDPNEDHITKLDISNQLIRMQDSLAFKCEGERSGHSWN